MPHQKQHQTDLDDHHHDHQAAHQEHLDWMEDARRWRDEYFAAVIEYVRRTRPELELPDYETTLERHQAVMEVAIDIHEQALERHEKALDLEQRGSRGASAGFEELHQELDSRHDASRRAHERLEQRHLAILEALGQND
jgi:hypothetical protein